MKTKTKHESPAINTRVAWLCAMIALVHVCPTCVSAAQVQTEKGEIVAECGIVGKKGEKISFDGKGSLQTRHAGYFEGKVGKTYTLTFRDDKGRIALLKCRGRIAWDEEARITEGATNFLSAITEANNGRWYSVISVELESGVLSLTVEKGEYTDFSVQKTTAPTKRKQALLLTNQQGHILGEPSFTLSGFAPSFDASGMIGKDTRNYKFGGK